MSKKSLPIYLDFQCPLILPYRDLYTSLKINFYIFQIFLCYYKGYLFIKFHLVDGIKEYNCGHSFGHYIQISFTYNRSNSNSTVL